MEHRTRTLGCVSLNPVQLRQLGGFSIIYCSALDVCILDVLFLYPFSVFISQVQWTFRHPFQPGGHHWLGSFLEWKELKEYFWDETLSLSQRSD